MLGKKARHVGNHARGLLAEAGSHFCREVVSDETLTARVRSKLGRVVSRPEDVEVMASEGTVTLRGIVRTEEYDDLFRGVSKVRGVRGVENQLKIKGQHDAPPAAEPVQVAAS
jgi:osmotically-inducible protein OsmY